MKNLHWQNFTLVVDPRTKQGGSVFVYSGTTLFHVLHRVEPSPVHGFAQYVVTTPEFVLIADSLTSSLYALGMARIPKLVEIYRHAKSQECLGQRVTWDSDKKTASLYGWDTLTLKPICTNLSIVYLGQSVFDVKLGI